MLLVVDDGKEGSGFRAVQQGIKFVQFLSTFLLLLLFVVLQRQLLLLLLVRNVVVVHRGNIQAFVVFVALQSGKT
jgi:hypothetical protein